MSEGYMVSPNGKRIWAVLGTIQVSAHIKWTDKRTWSYGGESKVHWDSQAQRLGEGGEPLFEDEDGEEWPFSMLKWHEESPAKPKPLLVECANCEWTGDCTEVEAIEDFWDRVSPGEIMPYGQCPECGCLCHEKVDDEKAQPEAA